MVKMKKIFKMYVILMLVCFCLAMNQQIYAESDETQEQAKILFLLDVSGSLDEEENVIYQTLNFLHFWLKEESVYDSAEVIVFSENAETVNIAEIGKFDIDGETRILKGLEEANKWVEEHKQSGNKLCIIGISDLIDDPYQPYTLQDAYKEQEQMDSILQEWDEYEEQDVLDYLFVTWNDENVKSLDEFEPGVQVVDKFKYDIPKKKNRFLLENQKESDNNEPISQIEMSGGLLMEIMKTLTGIDYEERIYKSLENKDNFDVDGSCKAYLILESEHELYEVESGTKLEPECDDGTIQVFCIDNELEGKTYQAYIKTDWCMAFCFYIPTPDGVVCSSNTKIVEGEEFSFCYILEEWYRSYLGVESVIVSFYKDGNIKVSKPMSINDVEEYQCTMCLDEEGEYSYEIKINEKNVIKTGIILVEEQKTSENFQDLSINESETKKIDSVMDIEKSWLPVIIIGVCIVGILLLGKKKFLK